MDTDKYEALLCVLDTGSMTLAAEKLGYTTSGVSRMIAALEKETGFALLTRDRGGILPSDGCEHMLPAIREAVHWARRCKQLAHEISGIETGSVTVGASYSAYYGWLAKIIAEYKKLYPNIEIRLREGNSSALCAAMDEHKADMCIISKRDVKYAWLPLKRDPLVAWVPGSHRLAQVSAFPVRAFETEPFIATYPEQETDNARMFAALNIKPNIQFTSTDSAATYAMVEAGLGVSLGNSIIAQNWGGNVTVLPLDPPQDVEIGIIYPQSDGLSPAAKRFVLLARASMPQNNDRQSI